MASASLWAASGGATRLGLLPGIQQTLLGGRWPPSDVDEDNDGYNAAASSRSQDSRSFLPNTMLAAVMFVISWVNAL
jgi:hypothetical protein